MGKFAPYLNMQQHVLRAMKRARKVFESNSQRMIERMTNLKDTQGDDKRKFCTKEDNNCVKRNNDW